MQSHTTHTHRRLLGIKLEPGISIVNAASFYLICFTGTLLSTFVPQFQPYLLTEFLNIPEQNHGTISGNLSFWGEVTLVFSTLLWGVITDKFGRRPVLCIGFLLMALGIILYPACSSYTELLAARIIFCLGVGGYGTISITLIADYFADGSRGKATGMQGVISGAGALVTVLVILRLPSVFEADGLTAIEAGWKTYQLVFAFTVAVVIVLYFGLSKINTQGASPKTSLLNIARGGLAAGKKPVIGLAYAAAFVARGNLAIVGTFFTLWAANYGTGELGMSRADALASAGQIAGIVGVSALLGAPLFGLLADKISHIKALQITLLITFFGYGGTYFIDNPLGSEMMVCAIFIGLAEIGCVITSSVLIAQQAPEHLRGVVVGCFNLFGALGIMIASKLGGWLFDHWDASGPFVCFSLFALTILAWSFFIGANHAASQTTETKKHPIN